MSAGAAPSKPRQLGVKAQTSEADKHWVSTHQESQAMFLHTQDAHPQLWPNTFTALHQDAEMRHSTLVGRVFASSSGAARGCHSSVLRRHVADISAGCMRATQQLTRHSDLNKAIGLARQYKLPPTQGSVDVFYLAHCRTTAHALNPPKCCSQACPVETSTACPMTGLTCCRAQCYLLRVSSYKIAPKRA